MKHWQIVKDSHTSWGLIDNTTLRPNVAWAPKSKNNTLCCSEFQVHNRTRKRDKIVFTCFGKAHFPLHEILQSTHEFQGYGE